MRFCPTCHTQYTDDSLRFCLQDGSILVSPQEAEVPTVVLDETPTIVRADEQGTPRTTQTDLTASMTERKSKIVRLVILAACVFLLLFASAAIGIWVYRLNLRETANRNSTSNSITNSKSPSNLNGYSPSPNSNSQTPLRVSTPPPPPTQTLTTADQEKTRDEVLGSVNNWNSAAERQDLSSYMSNYSDTVDYYRKGGVSRSVVRSDKSRAFAMYSSMLITISDMKVSVENNGSQATAEFDKEWAFRGTRNSSGRVRSQLRFRNENGRWLIIGERDLKVYNVN